MLTVPAFVWRGGCVRRAVAVGGAMGICLGSMAWLDSGVPVVGAIVFVVVGAFSGVWTSRRMVRYWPAAEQLTGDERVQVVRAVRRGEPVGNERLAQPAVAYVRGLHAAAAARRPWRLILGVVLGGASVAAVWDAVFGSWGSAVASVLYLAALALELCWWPKRQAALLTGADRAVA
ncbi:MAG: hypothetical protein WBB00_06665 [Mycobacterium sp.]